ncbi:hypothetical protein B0H17DRAFT_1048688 [Mycena rosella]|uniref:Uncharacterized protein n=1 Tax=Mycena rosella TaxID=1033263 RepID=A0AAD7GL51_MYCRO|nr:hypothetical protein B0H17DRAFT_1048688 [Mycena rosella]
MGFTGLARWVNAPRRVETSTRNFVNHNGQYKGLGMSVRSYRSSLGQIPGFQLPTERTIPRWVSVRPPVAGAPQRGQSGQQLSIEGHIFAIGTDLVGPNRKCYFSGRCSQGYALEAEYLPLPVLHSPIADGTSELLSNLLTSVLPNIPDAKTVAVTISDNQWEDVLWDREEEEAEEKERGADEKQVDNDIYACGDEGLVRRKDRDWLGVNRDRRSAYLIIGGLRSEGIL